MDLFLLVVLMVVPLGAVGLLTLIRDTPADTAEEVVALITDVPA